MKQYHILSLILVPIILVLIVILSPILAVLLAYSLDHVIMKQYYYVYRKVRRVKPLVERQVRGFLHSRKSPL